MTITHRRRKSRRTAPSSSCPGWRRPSTEQSRPPTAETVEAADGRDVHVIGGADVIRQALEAGLVDELTIIIAPVVTHLFHFGGVAYSWNWGRSSVISNHGAFEPTKMWLVGRIVGASTSEPIATCT